MFSWDQCLLQIDIFDILKFSVIVSLRGHRQTMFVHVYSISLIVSSKTRYHAEFDISKEPIERGCCLAGCELVAKAQGYQLVCFRGSLVGF